MRKKEASNPSKELSRLIEDVCDSMLKIPEPEISITENGPYATDTTLATLALGEDDPKIYLRPELFNDKPGIGPIQVFVIGHELRHLYQYYIGTDFSTYKKSNTVDLSAYNKQMVEIDANAFGLLCIKEAFMWDDIPDEILDLVFLKTPELEEITLDWMDEIEYALLYAEDE